jgi:hypothetical protein
MNWEAIGAIGEVLGAIGVIGSLLYLATQIRLSNRNYRIESARSVMNNFHDNSRDLATDPELRRIALTSVTGGYANLSPEDSSAWDFLMWRYIGNTADALQLRDKGLLDEESFNVVTESLLVPIRSVPDWWEVASTSSVTPPGLFNYVAERLKLQQDSSGAWGDQYSKWNEVGN